MNKDTTITFRVEPELHAQFNHAAEQMHRPAAQVLRELMRGYIKDTQYKSVTDTPTSSEPVLSAEAIQTIKALTSCHNIFELELGLVPELSLLTEKQAAQQKAIWGGEQGFREDCFNEAKASVELEGFKVPDAYQKEVARFIKQDIDFNQLTQFVHDYVKALSI